MLASRCHITEELTKDGIMQSISLEARNQDEHMKDAFKDLEVLMVRAGEMVSCEQFLCHIRG